VEPDEIDVLAFAVLRDFQQIEDAEKTGRLGKLRSDVREADGLDGIDFDLAIVHAVTRADFDVRPRPDPNAARDFAATNSFTEPFGKNHAPKSKRYWNAYAPEPERIAAACRRPDAQPWPRALSGGSSSGSRKAVAANAFAASGESRCRGTAVW
jgi:hypothetical protein